MYPEPGETIVDAHFSEAARQIQDLLATKWLAPPPYQVFPLGGYSRMEAGRVFVDSAFPREVTVPAGASRLSVYAEDYTGIALSLNISADKRTVDLALVNVPHAQAGQPGQLLLNPLVPEGLLGEACLNADTLLLNVSRPTFLILCWS